MNLLEDLCSTQTVLLLDGAMGTNLFIMGLPTGAAPELWNIEQPEHIIALHQRFIAAGSDLLLTNSFGANARRLMLHSAQDRVEELNAAAAYLCRQAIQQSKVTRNFPVAVLGSIGPTGDLLHPLGELDTAQAEQCFHTQALGLLDGGVDGLWLETFSAIDEARAAIRGIRRADSNIPIFLSMSFDTAGKTMMGVAPRHLFSLLDEEAKQLAGFGANCGIGPAELLESIIDMRDAATDMPRDAATDMPRDAATDMPRDAAAANRPYLLAKSNYGVPEFRQGEFHYHGSAPMMAEYAQMAYALGVKIIGGCCGTTPDTIKAMRAALDQAMIQKEQNIDMTAVNTFITQNRAQKHVGAASPANPPGLPRESTAPNDHSATDTRSGGQPRSRRRSRQSR